MYLNGTQTAWRCIQALKHTTMSIQTQDRRESGLNNNKSRLGTYKGMTRVTIMHATAAPGLRHTDTHTPTHKHILSPSHTRILSLFLLLPLAQNSKITADALKQARTGKWRGLMSPRTR